MRRLSLTQLAQRIIVGIGPKNLRVSRQNQNAAVFMTLPFCDFFDVDPGLPKPFNPHRPEISGSEIGQPTFPASSLQKETQVRTRQRKHQSGRRLTASLRPHSIKQRAKPSKNRNAEKRIGLLSQHLNFISPDIFPTQRQRFRLTYPSASQKKRAIRCRFIPGIQRTPCSFVPQRPLTTRQPHFKNQRVELQPRRNDTRNLISPRFLQNPLIERRRFDNLLSHSKLKNHPRKRAVQISRSRSQQFSISD